MQTRMAKGYRELWAARSLQRPRLNHGWYGITPLGSRSHGQKATQQRDKIASNLHRRSRDQWPRRIFSTRTWYGGAAQRLRWILTGAALNEAPGRQTPQRSVPYEREMVVDIGR
jgi:hypothetical protein